jgi:hypothetical protein
MGKRKFGLSSYRYRYRYRVLMLKDGNCPAAGHTFFTKKNILILRIHRHPSLDSFSDRMLYLVGLGLSDETDITVKGLEVAKNASRVYLEAYTSILLVDQAVLV